MALGADEDIQRMSEALKAGAKMTSDVCPVCASPIFEIKGELWCLKCNKKVVKIREDMEMTHVLMPYILGNLENAVVDKVEQMSVLLSRATEPGEVRSVAETLSALLELLSRSRSLKKQTQKQD